MTAEAQDEEEERPSAEHVDTMLEDQETAPYRQKEE
jgi:hypothetical protein